MKSLLKTIGAVAAVATMCLTTAAVTQAKDYKVAFIVGFLNNIMNLTGVDSYLQQVIKGAIIALAVGYDMWAKLNRTRKTLGAAKTTKEAKEEKP